MNDQNLLLSQIIINSIEMKLFMKNEKFNKRLNIKKYLIFKKI